MSKVYFVTGFSLATVVVATGYSTEAGYGVLLGESFTAFYACGVLTNRTFFEDGYFGGSVRGLFHGSISVGVVV